MMPTLRRPTAALLAAFFCLTLVARPVPAPAAEEAAPVRVVKPAEVLSDVLRRWADVIEPRTGQPAKTFTTTITVTKADGLPKELVGASLELSYQGPDRLRLTASVNDTKYALGRDGQEMWVHVPAKKFALVGS